MNQTFNQLVLQALDTIDVFISFGEFGNIALNVLLQELQYTRYNPLDVKKKYHEHFMCFLHVLWFPTALKIHAGRVTMLN